MAGEIGVSGENSQLVQLLRDAIDAAGGSISFSEYMDLALYAPGLGYYSASAEQFGGGGDFVTAPETSPLFARSLARQTSEVLGELGDGDVCEVGAGSGALAADLLEALAESNCLPRRYWIIERSARLREHQQAILASRLPDLMARVGWCDDCPRRFRGMLLANEVLDAMPADRFRVHAAGVRECRVGWQGDRFCWIEADCSGSALGMHIASILDSLDYRLPEGYESECAPARQAWINRFGERFERGVALLIDYGYARAEYYHPQRASGTLRCFHRHRVHDDPLLMAGLQDISVHVDFSALAEAAAAAGLAIPGYTTQGEFLLATGILDACRDVEPTTRRYAELTAQIKRLTLPGEMGEAVKVMALARDYDGPLTGFSGRDLRGRL